jgi:hypothetical protein
LKSTLDYPLAALRAPLSHKGRKDNPRQKMDLLPSLVAGEGLGMRVFNLYKLYLLTGTVKKILTFPLQ